MGHGDYSKMAAEELVGIPRLVEEEKRRRLAAALSSEAGQGEAYQYACRLLMALARKYPDLSPEFAPLPDLLGVLTQIDNATTGLQHPEPAQPKPEPSDDVAAIARDLRMWARNQPGSIRSSDELQAADALERLAKERDEADGWRIRYGEVVAKHAELEAALAKAQAEINAADDEIGDLKARIARLLPPLDTGAKAQAAVPEFTQAILHGDADHREWLIEAAGCFMAGKPLPPPRGGGTAAPPTPSDGLLREALREYVYETTHLSPERDGYHHCRIPNALLEKARAALAEQEKAKP